MIKRQRGRGRNPGQKPQNNNPNRAYESNGPDLKVRGSAQTVFEKYQQLGRDAQSNGDRVLGENYMQHAEHYFRMLRAMQPTFVPRTELMIAGYDDEYEDSDEAGQPSDARDTDLNEAGSAQPDFQQNRPQNQNRDRDNRERDNRDRGPRDFRDNRDNRDNRDVREPREPRDPSEARGEGDDGRYSRRRRRPDRFGNDGVANPQNGEAGGDQNAVRNDSRGEYRSDNRGEGRGEGRSDGRGDGRGEGQGRREGRPAYRDDNRAEGQSNEAPAPRSEAFEQPEFHEPAGFSNPQEIIVKDEGEPAVARERRPRPPRAPRAPREAAAKAPETGFGDEMPAFLSAPIPPISSE